MSIDPNIMNATARQIYSEFGNDAALLEQVILQRAAGADQAQGSDYSLSELIYAYANLTGTIPEFDPPEAYDELWKDDATFEMLGQLDRTIYRGVDEIISMRQDQLTRIREQLGAAGGGSGTVFDDFDDLEKFFTGDEGANPTGLSLLDAHQLREVVSFLIKSGRGYAALLKIGNFSRLPQSANYQARLLDKYTEMQARKAEAISALEDIDETDPEGQAEAQRARNLLNNIEASARILESTLELLEQQDQEYIRMVSDKMQSHHQNILSIQSRMA